MARTRSDHSPFGSICLSAHRLMRGAREGSPSARPRFSCRAWRPLCSRLLTFTRLCTPEARLVQVQPAAAPHPAMPVGCARCQGLPKQAAECKRPVPPCAT